MREEEGSEAEGKDYGRKERVVKRATLLADLPGSMSNMQKQKQSKKFFLLLEEMEPSSARTMSKAGFEENSPKGLLGSDYHEMSG